MLEETSTEGHEWNGPAHCQVETMTWNFEEEEIRYTRNCKYIWFQKLEPF